MTLAVALMAITGAAAIHWQNVLFGQAQAFGETRYQQARHDAPSIYKMGCDDWYHSAKVRICAFGSEDSPRTAVVMGDSIGLQWFPAFEKIFGRPGWRLLVLTKSSCPMVDQAFFYPRIGREYTECEQWRNDAIRAVAALKPDALIFGSSVTYGFSSDEWQEGTTRVLQLLSGAVEHIAILRSTPTLPFDGPSCASPRSRLHALLTDNQRCTSPAVSTGSDIAYRSLLAAAAQFSNVDVIDMTDEVCPDGLCHAERDGVIVYRDSQHLSAAYAASLADTLGRRLGIPAAKTNDDLDADDL